MKMWLLNKTLIAKENMYYISYSIIYTVKVCDFKLFKFIIYGLLFYILDVKQVEVVLFINIFTENRRSRA